MSQTQIGIPLIDVDSAGQQSTLGIEPHVKISKILLYATIDGNTGITYGPIQEDDPSAYDITKITMEMEFTESMHSMAVIGSLTLIDNYNLFQDARIHGQEKIHVRFWRFNPASKTYDSYFDREFLVTNVKAMTRHEFRAVYTLEFASPHVYFDKLKRIGRAYGFVELSEESVTQPKDQYANDVSGALDSIRAWRSKYTEESGKMITYANIFETTGGSSDIGIASEEINEFKYPEQFAYDILRQDLGLPPSKVWLYGYHPMQAGYKQRTILDRMKVIIPNWRPLQAVQWLIRNTFTRKIDKQGKTYGHPWFCYDTLLAGIRIEPYEMIIKGSASENELDSSAFEMYSTGRTSKSMTGTYIYNPQYQADPESVDYFTKMHRKILELDIGFSFDKYTKSIDGSFSTREWYVDVATKWAMPNITTPIKLTKISYSDKNITQGVDTLSADHYLSYADDVGGNAPDLEDSNYTYYIPYNSALHGLTEDTFPYNMGFGFGYESGNGSAPSSASSITGGVGGGSGGGGGGIGGPDPYGISDVAATPDPTTQQPIQKASGSPLGDASYRVSSKFGRRKSPTAGASSNHKGIDLAAPTGTPVVSPYEGEVVYAGTASGYGNYIKIKHADNTTTSYGHLSQLNVKSGDKVSPGQRIGAVGSTGVSTGPHLHYEVRKNGIPQDPAPYISGTGGEIDPNMPTTIPNTTTPNSGSGRTSQGGASGSSGYSAVYSPSDLGRVGRVADMIRKNIDFMQHTMKVMGDFNLNPGMIVSLTAQRTIDPQLLPYIESLRDEPSDLIDRYISGKYFVSECTHVFKEMSFYTYATLNRDSSSKPLDQMINTAPDQTYSSTGPNTGSGEPGTVSPVKTGGFSGKLDPQDAYDHLRKRGLTHEQAMGMLANIQAESSFNPGAEGDTNLATSSFGLFQHRGERFTNLKAFAAARGTSWTDPYTQMDFALQEPAGRKYKNTSFDSAADATYQWTVEFEVPANKEVKGRQRAGNLPDLNRKINPGNQA